MVIIDYLQIIPVPDEVKRRSGIDEDQWRIERMQALKDACDGEPVFVISEARKKKQGQATWTEDLADVMGSARGSYSPDAVLLLNPFSNAELVERLEVVDGRLQPRRGEPEDLTPDQIKKQSKPIRALLELQKKDYATLRVAKVRDGGTKADITLTNFWRLAQSVEGMC
jgi:hypothetical protein